MTEEEISIGLVSRVEARDDLEPQRAPHVSLFLVAHGMAEAVSGRSAAPREDVVSWLQVPRVDVDFGSGLKLTPGNDLFQEPGVAIEPPQRERQETARR